MREMMIIIGLHQFVRLRKQKKVAISQHFGDRDPFVLFRPPPPPASGKTERYGMSSREIYGIIFLFMSVHKMTLPRFHEVIRRGKLINCKSFETEKERERDNLERSRHLANFMSSTARMRMAVGG